MSEREVDEHTGTETTGHEWDGIKELDTPLPRWWLWIFYACIAIAVVYWILMPAWPGLRSSTPGILHQSSRAQVDAGPGGHGGPARRRRAGQLDQRVARADRDAIPACRAMRWPSGSRSSRDNCAPCHGPGGTGGKGYPNLRDDVWLWGGSLEDIQRTITYGVRSGDPNARDVRDAGVRPRPDPARPTRSTT